VSTCTPLQVAEHKQAVEAAKAAAAEEGEQGGADEDAPYEVRASVHVCTHVCA